MEQHRTNVANAMLRNNKDDIERAEAAQREDAVYFRARQDIIDGRKKGTGSN